MQEFLIILIVAFILSGLIRRMMFGSFYAAMKKHQRELEKQEQDERKRKREGKIVIEKINPGQTSLKNDGEYVDYEEVN